MGLSEAGERRLIGEVFRYWNERRGRAGESEDTMLASLEDAPFWPQAFILEILPEGTDFRVQHWGKGLGALTEPLKPGQSMSERSSRLMDLVSGLGVAAVRARKPVANSDRTVNRDGDEVLYRVIVAPIVGGDGQVLSVFGAANCRVLAAAGVRE